MGTLTQYYHANSLTYFYKAFLGVRWFIVITVLYVLTYQHS